MTTEKHFTAEQAKEIGEKLGIDWSKFDVEQFRIGMDVELEHGLEDSNTNVTNNDPLMTGKIALAHLNEFPDYYTRLEKMEKEGEEFHEKKSMDEDEREQSMHQQRRDETKYEDKDEELGREETDHEDREDY